MMSWFVYAAEDEWSNPTETLMMPIPVVIDIFHASLSMFPVFEDQYLIKSGRK